MECLHCHKEFTPQRQNAQFCSASCRAKNHNASRTSTQTPNQVTVQQNNPRIMNTGFMGLSGNPSFDYMFQRTEAENLQLKGEISRMKEKYETLNDKYRDLKLDEATKDKLNDAEKALAASKGLGGFVDKITGNDRLMDAIEKIAMHKLGIGEDKDPDMLQGADQNRELLETILAIIRDQDEVFLAHFLKMTQYYAINPTLLVASANNINKANKILNNPA